MPTRLRDRLTPTAVGLVSRAWVIEEVEAREQESSRHAALIDQLVAFEPPRQHALRNMFLFWAMAIGASGLAGELGLPGWAGFAAVIVLFAWLARLLAVKALRWRLDQLLAGLGEDPVDRGTGAAWRPSGARLSRASSETRTFTGPRAIGSASAAARC